MMSRDPRDTRGIHDTHNIRDMHDKRDKRDIHDKHDPHGRRTRPGLRQAISQLTAYKPSGAGRAKHPPRGTARRALVPDGAETLARWLATAEATGSPDQLWQLLQARGYADLWYGARTAGEAIRAKALERLYARRSHPGGAHPDPREPAAFSPTAVLAAAARHLGLAWYLAPRVVAEEADKLVAPAHRPLLAWLIAYPERHSPDLVIRASGDPDAMRFAAACAMGYFAREAPRLTDPDAPAGIVIPPSDPLTLPILHQFAKALLRLEEDACPPGSGCMCAHIRARYNAPPADHPQPTDTLDAEAVREEAEREETGRPLGERAPGEESLPDPCECR